MLCSSFGIRTLAHSGEEKGALVAEVTTHAGNATSAGGATITELYAVERPGDQLSVGVDVPGLGRISVNLRLGDTAAAPVVIDVGIGGLAAPLEVRVDGQPCWAGQGSRLRETA